MAILIQAHISVGTRLVAGAVAGVIGGILMAMVEMFYHGVITGMGIWTMPDMIATLAGQPMHHDFGGYTMLGMMMHLAFSAFLGGLFGFVFARTPNPGLSAMLGLVYGYVLYLIMFYAVTPAINPMFADARGVAQIVAHLVFGMSFALYPRLVRSFSPITL